MFNQTFKKTKFFWGGVAALALFWCLSQPARADLINVPDDYHAQLSSPVHGQQYQVGSSSIRFQGSVKLKNPSYNYNNTWVKGFDYSGYDQDCGRKIYWWAYYRFYGCYVTLGIKLDNVPERYQSSGEINFGTVKGTFKYDSDGQPLCAFDASFAVPADVIQDNAKTDYALVYPIWSEEDRYVKEQCDGTRTDTTIKYEHGFNIGTFTEHINLRTPFYLLTVNKTGNGVVLGTGINCGSDCSESYPQGTSVSLTAAPDAGSKFSNWGGDAVSCGVSLTCSVLMNSAKNVTVTFSAIIPDFTASLSANPTSGNMPLKVNFTATRSGTTTGTINYLFDFNGDGDFYNDGAGSQFIGVPETETTKSTAYTYNTAGTYNVRVRIEQGALQRDSAPVTITVSCPSSFSYFCQPGAVYDCTEKPCGSSGENTFICVETNNCTGATSIVPNSTCTEKGVNCESQSVACPACPSGTDWKEVAP